MPRRCVSTLVPPLVTGIVDSLLTPDDGTVALRIWHQVVIGQLTQYFTDRPGDVDADFITQLSRYFADRAGDMEADVERETR